MSDSSTKKKCAICGEVVDAGLLRCPSCGRGVFESRKVHWHHHGSGKGWPGGSNSTSAAANEGILEKLANLIGRLFGAIGGRKGITYIDVRSEDERRSEENARRKSRSDLGEENERLVNELMSFLAQIRKVADSPSFDTHSFDALQNQIHMFGQRLNDKGGRELMLIFHSRIAALGENARLVEQIWWEGHDSIR